MLKVKLNPNPYVVTPPLSHYWTSCCDNLEFLITIYEKNMNLMWELLIFLHTFTHNSASSTWPLQTLGNEGNSI